VEERTKDWFDTSAAGGIFLRERHGVRRISSAIPTRVWQIICLIKNQKSCQDKRTSVPPPTNKTKIANGLSCWAQVQLKKKINFLTIIL